MNGFIREVEGPLPVDCRFERSNVFSVARREGEKEIESVLYVREHLVDLEKKIMKEFWNNKKKSRLYVKGPPGCGKTCFFYLWARLRSVEENKRVLIVQFRLKDSCFIWIREAGGALWLTKQGIEPMDILEEVKKVLKMSEAMPFDLCIHDGVLDGNFICDNMLGKLNTAVVNKVIKKVVHVTSLAFSLSTGGQALDPKGPIERLSVDSWRLDDYIEATSCPAFAKQMGTILRDDKNALNEDVDEDEIVDDEAMEVSDGNMADEDGEGSGDGDSADDGESSGDGDMADDGRWSDVVETKYYFAGGSARFTFDFPLSSLRRELDEQCSRVLDDEWTYFSRSDVAPNTPVAVNTLMQQFEGKTSPISKYILFRAYEKCRSKLVKAVKAAAAWNKNPAMKGWAFELEQIELIRMSFESNLSRQDNSAFTSGHSTCWNPQFITNNRGLSFCPDSEVEFDEESLTTNRDVQDGTIIWCLKWNQGCFDVAFYKEETLFTLHFTISSEHSLKPRFIRKLRHALVEKGVVVNGVVHLGVGEGDGAFRFKNDQSGTGRQRRALEPQFLIKAYHSPPLELSSDRPTVVFQTDSEPLDTVDMW
jgi:hypothetical protein